MTNIDAYRGEEPFFFVCYSHADKDNVYTEMQWIHDVGVRLWYDEGIEVGVTWRQALAEALDKAVGVIFMCSRDSLTSGHCRKELSYALDHVKPILVVRLDTTELPPDLALYLSDTQLLDRSRYPPNEYRQKLLTALNRLGSSRIEQTPSPSLHKHTFLKVGIACTALVALAALGLGYLYIPAQNPVPLKASMFQPGEIRFPTIAMRSSIIAE